MSRCARRERESMCGARAGVGGYQAADGPKRCSLGRYITLAIKGRSTAETLKNMI